MKISTSLLFAVIMISGYRTKNGNSKVFSYKNSYVGDNIAVSHILNQLEDVDFPKWKMD